MTIDIKIVELILASGVGGIGVRALTAIIKKWLPAIKGFWILLVNFAVCAGATAVYFAGVGWNWAGFITYSLAVFFVGQFSYQATK